MEQEKISAGLACNGEGFGHVARTVALYRALSDEFDLQIFAPNTVHQFLARQLPGAVVHAVPHLHLHKSADRIDFYRTFRENLPTLTKLRTNIVRTGHMLRDSGIRVLVNDFEPFTAIAAKRLGIPVLQFNHPGIIAESPSFSPDALAAKLVARLMMPAYDKRIFCSFYNGDVGPMIRQELMEAPRSQGDYFLLNLKEGYRKPVLKRLHKLGITNYRLFPDSTQNYTEAFAGCRAVITSAGHQTLSEAICLGKPVLALPQRGQYEQRLNARMLDASGWGRSSSIRTFSRDLPRFIAELDSYPRRALPFFQFTTTNDADNAFRKIRSFIRKHNRFQGDILWNAIFPAAEQEREFQNLWGALPPRQEDGSFRLPAS